MQCWISVTYDAERLWLHYLWVFLVEFGTVVIYISLCIWLARRLDFLRSCSTSDYRKITRAARYMVLYPVGYVLFTLPLATGRMIILSGGTVSPQYLLASGCLLASCGWFDGVAYIMTRRVLLKADITGPLSDPSPHTTTTRTQSACIDEADFKSPANIGLRDLDLERNPKRREDDHSPTSFDGYSTAESTANDSIPAERKTSDESVGQAMLGDKKSTFLMI